MCIARSFYIPTHFSLPYFRPFFSFFSFASVLRYYLQLPFILPFSSFCYAYFQLMPPYLVFLLVFVSIFFLGFLFLLSLKLFLSLSSSLIYLSSHTYLMSSFYIIPNVYRLSTFFVGQVITSQHVRILN